MKLVCVVKEGGREDEKSAEGCALLNLVVGRVLVRFLARIESKQMGWQGGG